MRKLKLIWDFKGPDGLKIAEHHAKHLQEFAEIENYKHMPIGFEALTDVHAIAFLIIPEDQMKPLRDALKPHRGQVYSEE
ncbi:hypothetical protein BXY82_2769 [Gelidibacter sediminis]|uniref:YCII-related domain-containing protein n=1 Tax=Gelidibacter sediminis TaxID=1608710 RepID=A0A4R7PJE6_9FLAO|nr:hypothetical protein [Gelidibacter sediminis]TDU34447.1 hypothetical protein BXY82_2769 [Gelidibacter sediminis]